MRNINQHDDFLRECKNADFSKYSRSKEKYLRVLLENRNILMSKNIEGASDMEKKRKIQIKKAISLAAAAIAAAALLTGVVYASGFYKVISEVVLGNHSRHYMVEYPDAYQIPEQLEGKLFGSDGSLLTALTQQNGPIYNDKGEEVYICHDGQGNFSAMTAEEYRANQAEQAVVEFYDLSEGTGRFITEVLEPGYLPEGYAFEKVRFLFNSKEDAVQDVSGSKYMIICYSNGINEFTTMLRFMDEETAYESIGDYELKEITVNGYPAVISGGMLTVLVGNVEYAFFSKGDVDMEELIKIAESLQ